jgi:phage shock protein C
MNKRLYRSNTNKKIAGIAGGIGEYFDIDPMIVRLIFVFSALAWGFSILMYIIMWFILPEDPTVISNENVYGEDFEKSSFQTEIKPQKKSSRNKQFFAYLIILIGVLTLMDNILPYWNYFKLWPLALIFLGAYIIYNSRSKN